MDSRSKSSIMQFSANLQLGVLACALILASIVGGELASLAGTGDVPEQIQAIFTQMKEGSVKWKEARSQLAALPSEQAVPALVEQLSGNPDLQDTETRWPTPGRVRGYGHGRRRLAYLALREHNAVETEIGYEQCVACLVEPQYSSFCAKTLIDEAPEGKRSDVVAHIGRFFGDPKIPDIDKDGIVFRLGRKGPSMAPYLEHIEAVFANREAGERLRWMAANAMLRIGGLRTALPHFQEIDAGGQKGVMTALARFIGESDEECDYHSSPEYHELRDRARKLVLNGMTNPDTEVRKAALEAFSAAFGVDIVIIHSLEEHEWNPEPRSALEKMAHKDPDPGLRERAARVLEMDLDSVAARIRRLLARAEQNDRNSQEK